MKNYLFTGLILIISCKSYNAQSPLNMNYQDIHNTVILIDSHNDFLTKTIEDGYVLDSDLIGKTHTDLVRLQEGGVNAQFFSIWCDKDQKSPFKLANLQIDSLDLVIERNPKLIAKATSSDMIIEHFEAQKLSALIGIEGGHIIENSLSNLDVLYNRGARYLTLTHNNSTSWATSAAFEMANNASSKLGLNDFGINVIKHMNTLGMMIDVSHVGEQTFWDVIKVSQKPIIASHSSVYNLCPHPRNLKDEQIKAIAKNNGVIQVNFFSLFLDKSFEEKYNSFLEEHASEKKQLINSGMNRYSAETYVMDKYKDEADAMRPKLEILIEHIEYIINLVGMDYVGLGSDFDGVPSTPKQLDDVSCYPLLTKSLIEKGYSQEDISKIYGGNLLRVLKANEF